MFKSIGGIFCSLALLFFAIGCSTNNSPTALSQSIITTGAVTEIALAKTATFARKSAGWSSNYANAYDGASSTKANAKSADTLEFNLGGTYTLTHATMLEDNGGTMELGAWKVQYYNGTIWQDCFAYATSTIATVQDNDFADVTGATKIRLCCTALSGKTIEIQGFQCYGYVAGGTSYTLTTIANPTAGGDVLGAGSYPSGATATVTATPGPLYIFTGWSGNLTGTTNPATITMDAAKSVTANFQLKTFTITPSAGPNGSILPGGPVTKTIGGTPETFTMVPYTGYVVNDVLVDGASVGAVSSYTFTSFTSNHTISVTFKQATTPPPGTKLTIGSSTSGTSQTGNEAVKSYDNSTTTRFCSNGALANAWIQYDLGAVQVVTKVRLLMYNGTSRTYPIKIEVGGVQVFAGNTVTQASGTYWEQSFAPTSGQTIKITMTANNSSNNGYLSIFETEIHGSPNLLAGPWVFSYAPIVRGAPYTINGNSISFPFSGVMVTYDMTGQNYPYDFGLHFSQPVAITQGSKYRLILDATLEINGGYPYFAGTTMSGCAAPVVNPADGSVDANGQVIMDFEVTSDPGASPVIDFSNHGIFSGVGDGGVGVENHSVKATLIKMQ